MASEMFRRDKMNAQPARSGYVGAVFEDERRVVLVPVSEDEPWEAFRQMRRVMRRERKQASLSLFESATPIERTADVIELSSRRRAG